PITLDPAQSYRLVFTGAGPALTGQVFSLGDLSTPLATVAATDPTYPSGSVGLGVSALETVPGGSADATFDNFVAATAVPEPVSLTLLVTGAVGLLGRGWWRRKQRPGN